MGSGRGFFEAILSLTLSMACLNYWKSMTPSLFWSFSLMRASTSSSLQLKSLE